VVLGQFGGSGAIGFLEFRKKILSMGRPGRGKNWANRGCSSFDRNTNPDETRCWFQKIARSPHARRVISHRRRATRDTGYLPFPLYSTSAPISRPATAPAAAPAAAPTILEPGHRTHGRVHVRLPAPERVHLHTQRLKAEPGGVRKRLRVTQPARLVVLHVAAVVPGEARRGQRPRRKQAAVALLEPAKPSYMHKLRKGTLTVFQYATRRGTPRGTPSSEYPWGTPLWGARWVLLLGVPF